jgi:hypothetical protein
MKKVLIQNNEQLELVREEIRVSSLFNHSNLLPLLDHAIISVKVITASCSSFSDYCRWISHKVDVAFVIKASYSHGWPYSDLVLHCWETLELLRVELSFGVKSDF